jgi:hypothetical protein
MKKIVFCGEQNPPVPEYMHVDLKQKNAKITCLVVRNASIMMQTSFIQS